MELRRRSQEQAAGRLGIDMKLDRGRRNADGCLDFHESAFVKEVADHAKELRADAQNGAELLQSFDRFGLKLRFQVSPLHLHAYPLLTRSKYLPVRVSMRIVSPLLMNRGTPTSYPLASFAGFRTFVAVSPRAPGSVSAITFST